MTVTIDPNTGLPELPEGYFWRVVDGYFANELHIRKKFGPFSIKQEERVLNYYTFENGFRELLDPAEEIKRVAADMGKELSDPWAAYIGDYPPKKLETA